MLMEIEVHYEQLCLIRPNDASLFNSQATPVVKMAVIQQPRVGFCFVLTNLQ